MLSNGRLLEHPFTKAKLYSTISTAFSSPPPHYLVIVDELLQFIRMHNNVKAAHLGQAELFPIHARKADLEGGNVKDQASVTLSLRGTGENSKVLL